MVGRSGCVEEEPRRRSARKGEGDETPLRNRKFGRLLNDSDIQESMQKLVVKQCTFVTMIVWGRAKDVKLDRRRPGNYLSAICEGIRKSLLRCNDIVAATNNEFVTRATHSDTSIVFDSEATAPFSHASTYPVLTYQMGIQSAAATYAELPP